MKLYKKFVTSEVLKDVQLCFRPYIFEENTLRSFLENTYFSYEMKEQKLFGCIERSKAFSTQKTD